MNLRTIVTAMMCGALLLVAACGGDDDDGDDGAPAAGISPAATEVVADPPTASSGDDGGGDDADCDLLTAEEVAEALGGPSQPVQVSTVGEGFNQCLWRIEGGDELGSAVVLQTRGDLSRDEFDEVARENSPEVAGELKAIDGLGDAAWEQVATFVLSGDQMVVVTVINGDADGGTARQQPLARSAIERLP